MDGADRDRKRAGFRERTRVDDARAIFREAVAGSDAKTGDDGDLEAIDTDDVFLRNADGRVLATSIAAGRAVPHYERAAMDGFAVAAADTFGASERSPAVVRLRESGPIEPGTATRVHTGSPIPDGADAVVRIERAEAIESAGELEITDAVAESENVAPVGEDVAAGQHLYDAGHRLRPSDLGLLRSVGVERVRVATRPSVGVIPTGEEVVEADPEPGEVIETNGLTVSRLVERWGGRATHRDVVTDDPEALRVAIERDLPKDVVVTTGGSSVGERDHLPEVVEDLGEVLVHGVALKPGHPVALGIVAGTPVLSLPGYPVACLVNAVQFLRPTLAWLQGRRPAPHPRTEARLERKIPSEPGIRTFARVTLEGGDGDAGSNPSNDADLPAAVPTRASGSGVLSSVALADGWVVVPEEREGIPEGETVAVEDWESHP